MTASTLAQVASAARRCRAQQCTADITTKPAGTAHDDAMEDLVWTIQALPCEDLIRLAEIAGTANDTAKMTDKTFPEILAKWQKSRANCHDHDSYMESVMAAVQLIDVLERIDPESIVITIKTPVEGR